MSRKYYKDNYVDAVKIITPDVYLDNDLEVSGYTIKATDKILNSHFIAAKNIPLSLGISSIAHSNLFSSVGNVSGFSQYFIPQNKTISVGTQKFQHKILTPLGVKMIDYNTKDSFRTYLSGTLLPKIHLNSNTLHTDTSSVFASTASGTHVYLMENMGWLYFLNTSAVDENFVDYAPSTVVASSITETLFLGKDYQLNDGIKDYQTYLWSNYASLSSVSPEFLPGDFTSGTGSYTSGNQNLTKLHTLIDVIYSPLYLEKTNTRVRDAFEAYLTKNTLLSARYPAGPLQKFLTAIAYSIFDTTDQIEGMSRFTSIDACPPQFLSYVAELVGWTLYGQDEKSWRNQIRNAVSLYKKKGTKQGIIDALNTILVQNPIDASSLITELYESYIPNLIYYSLKTESPLFTFDKYTVDEAASLGITGYSYTDMDQNIRSVVDHILQQAVRFFPTQFVIGQEPFRVSMLPNGEAWFGPIVENIHGDWFTGTYISASSTPLAIVGDPEFTFNYRGRDFGIPPWEEEKFYRSCLINRNLLEFIKHQLSNFCVPLDFSTKVADYVYNYSLSGSDTTDLYIGNGFVFFTSSQEYPPNYERIIKDFDRGNFEYLSLWNGKSSTYDFTVCAGHFSSTYFGDASSRYTTNEIIESLRVVDEFTPAKAMARVRLNKANIDSFSGTDFICPTVSKGIFDVPGALSSPYSGAPFSPYPTGSGAMSNFTFSGVWDRNTGYAMGGNKYPGFDDSRSSVQHQQVPVFSRKQAEFSNNITDSVVNTTEVVPSTSSVNRRSLRRRNFYNVLDEDDWYGRDGRNMPSWYNNTCDVPPTRDLHLGFIPSSYTYADTTAENLSGVYSRDSLTDKSQRSYHGLNVSNAFPSRGISSIEFSSCDPYVRRDGLAEELELFFTLHERKKRAIAKDLIYNSRDLLSASSAWANLESSFANMIPDTGLEKYFSPDLDIRSLNRRTFKGIHSVYHDYNKYFLSGNNTGAALPEKLVRTYTDGGANILSHTYGPLYYNAYFNIDGVAINTSANLISSSVANPFKINFAAASAHYVPVGLTQVDSSALMYFGFPEYRSGDILSSIMFIDSVPSPGITPANNFVIYDLDKSERVYGSDNYLIDNRAILLQHGSHGLPRIRTALRIGDKDNIFIPEHDFELTLNYLTGSENSNTIGGGKIGAILHTKREVDINGEAVFFVWTPEQKWEMVYIKDIINGDASINNLLSQYTHVFSDERKDLSRTQSTCEEDISYSNLQSMTKEDFSKGVVKFHTKNNITNPPSKYATVSYPSLATVYNGHHVQVHRAENGPNTAVNDYTSQNYFLSIFALPSINNEEFVLLDHFDVVDKTLNNAASIPYKGTLGNLDKQKLSLLDDEVKLFWPEGTQVMPVLNTESFYVTTVGNILGGSARQPFAFAEIIFSQVQVHSPFLLPETLGNKINRMYPYVGVTVESYTNTDMGWNMFLAHAAMQGQDHRLSGGFSLGGVSLFKSKLQKYFFSRSTKSMFPNISESQHAIGSEGAPLKYGFFSVGRWSDTIFWGYKVNDGYGANPTNPTIATNYVDETGFPGVSPPYVGENGQAGKIPAVDYRYLHQGFLQPYKLASTHDDQTSPVVPDGISYRNPLGYNWADDRPPAITGMSQDSFTGRSWLGAPQELCFASLRFNPVQGGGHEDLNIYQEDRYKHRILNPLPSEANLNEDEIFNAYGKWSVPTFTPCFPPLESEDTDSGGTPIPNLMDWKRTFAPQTMYQDVPKSYLQHGKNYTFSIYLARPPHTFGDPPMHGLSTSAIVNIAPIGSKTSYTQTILDFGSEPGTGAIPATSSIQVAGHSLVGSDAARITDLGLFTHDGGGPLEWYKLEVTIPYDAMEPDIWAGEPEFAGNSCLNLGLRIQVRAYNNNQDGDIPENTTPLLQRPLNILSKLLMWGAALHQGDALPWMRTHEDVLVDTDAFTQVLSMATYTTQNDLLSEVATDREIIQSNDGTLKSYSLSTSSLLPLTIASDSINNYLYTTDLYKKCRVLDASGNVYGKNIILDDTGVLVRKGISSGEHLADRHVTLEGTERGSNITYPVQGVLPLEPKELLHLLRYFNKIGKKNRGSGFNTRVASDASGYHDVSGGSRVSYRLNPLTTGIGTTNGTFGNFTQLDTSG